MFLILTFFVFMKTTLMNLMKTSEGHTCQVTEIWDPLTRKTARISIPVKTQQWSKNQFVCYENLQREECLGNSSTDGDIVVYLGLWCDMVTTHLTKS